MDGVDSDVSITSGKTGISFALVKRPEDLLQKRPRIQKPSLAHEGAMCQIAHVA